MYIKQMILKDFKSYENTCILFDDKFNVLIGENNIGKTTLFEALQLWKKCFDTSIISSGKGFYSLSVPLYISFAELYFLRLTKDEDIFFGNKHSCEITIQISDNNDENYSLGFQLTKPNITNSYIRISRINSHEFNAFKTMLDSHNIKLREFLFIQQTSPVAKVLSKEPYMFKGQILKKIEKGKSNEVLRNKILQSLNKGNNLETWLQEVLDMEFTFKVPPRMAREKEEYIDLCININGKKLDIYLQGSGFLQAAEIFSSIDIMDNALNIMLIDEPDSHISPRIQNNLLTCLRHIENTQTFVISHNDNFVADLEPQNVIFISNENKLNGSITPLNDINIDSLHSSLGGIISGLTRLQRSKRVVFVEGKDDIEYLKKLNNALSQFNSTNCIDFNNISFWFIRGKDYIIQKVMTGKQLLSQAVEDCHYAAIFDKDFTTSDANTRFKSIVNQRLGASSKVHTHNGYCIESVLFSDINQLVCFLRKLLDPSFDIDRFVQNFILEKSDSMKNVQSDLYTKLKGKFISQKKDSRPELDSVDFDTFAAEASSSVQYLMLKDNIAEFVLTLENEYGHTILQRDDDDSETISSHLLEKYFSTLDSDENLYSDYKELLNVLRSL